MSNFFKFLFVSMLLVMLTGCGEKAAVVSSGIGPQSWIDAPLDGMQIPLAPYEVVFHITDDQAVSSGELSINDSIVATLDNPKPGSNLATLRYIWNPPSPGVYTLRTRAQSEAKAWGDYSQVVVLVGEPTTTSTPTPVDTPTITPTITSTPTITPTATATRRPGPDKITFVNPHPNTNQIYFRGSGCGRKEVDFYVTIPAAAKASQVTVYYRLVDRTNSGHFSGWYSKAMYLASGTGEEWLASVNPEAEISGSAGYPEAIVEFYFSAVNSLNSTPVTSNVISSVKLDICNH